MLDTALATISPTVPAVWPLPSPVADHRDPRPEILTLAAEWVHLGDSATDHDRFRILADLAGWTPAIPAVTRDQQWDSLVTQTRILVDLDWGGEFADDQVRMAYGIDYPNVTDRERLADEAACDREAALAVLTGATA